MPRSAPAASASMTASGSSPSLGQRPAERVADRRGAQPGGDRPLVERLQEALGVSGRPSKRARSL